MGGSDGPVICPVAQEVEDCLCLCVAHVKPRIQPVWVPCRFLGKGINYMYLGDPLCIITWAWTSVVSLEGVVDAGIAGAVSVVVRVAAGWDCRSK